MHDTIAKRLLTVLKNFIVALYMNYLLMRLLIASYYVILKEYEQVFLKVKMKLTGKNMTTKVYLKKL